MTDGDGEDVTVSGTPTPAPEGGPATGGVGADFGGAPDDEEMPLADHVEEMVRRLLYVILVLIGVSVPVFILVADDLINFLWYSFLPGTFEACDPNLVREGEPCPRVYHPLALLLARLKVASLVGFVAALPFFVYQTYAFMRPGLYPNERRYYKASVPTSLVLAGIGLLFAYFLVLPLIFTYFLGYTEGSAEIAFSLSDTFTLILMMLGLFAVVFQIPLFIMLAIMMGVTSRRWLESRRLYFWAGFAGVAFLFSPDPTGMAPFVVGATMVLLFEGTLALLRWSGHGSIAPGPREIAGLRPIVWLLVAAVSYIVSPAPMPAGYYDRLPDFFTGAFEYVGVAGFVPVVVGLAVIAAFEGLALALRRTRAPRQLRYLLARVRAPVWIVVVGIGYMAHPNPVVLQRLDVALLTMEAAAGLAVLLLVLYEGGLIVWRKRNQRGRR